jgi:hypothetical protein
VTELRRVALRINHALAVIDVAPDAPTALAQRLAELLPYTTELHYAKISGQSVLFLVPFFIPPQQTVHVNRLVRGTVAYWPNRQQILCYYGAFEKEDASVLVLGRISEGLDRVAAAGEELRRGMPTVVRLEALARSIHEGFVDTPG